MPAGRPRKYNAKYHIPWIRGLAMDGLTVEEIAEKVGIAKSTLYAWMKRDEELSNALNEGRERSDIKVVESLYSRAIGSKTTERKTIVTTDSNGVSTPSRVEITEKEYPPDTASMIFWLKNRDPGRWRESRSPLEEEAESVTIVLDVDVKPIED